MVLKLPDGDYRRCFIEKIRRIGVYVYALGEDSFDACMTK